MLKKCREVLHKFYVGEGGDGSDAKTELLGVGGEWVLLTLCSANTQGDVEDRQLR